MNQKECKHEQLWLDTPQITRAERPILSYHCVDCGANVLVDVATGKKEVLITK